MPARRCWRRARSSGSLPAGILLLQARRFPPRPEDRPDATLAEGAGPVDKFPASTVWPFVFGFGATVFATGFVFGVWVVLGGAIVLVFGVIGMIRQSPRVTLHRRSDGYGVLAGSSTST